MEQGIREGDSPVCASEALCEGRITRVELLGIAAQSWW